MDLGILGRLFPSLETRALLDERKFDMNRSDKYNDRYVIPMHRKNVWTKKWMQDPRNNLLQIDPYDLGAKYIRGWGLVTRKIGLTLCYSCRRLGHLDKECLGGRPSCLCCKSLDHEVLDCARMITKLEKMNLLEENPKVDSEIAEPQKESEKMLLQMKDTLNDNQHVRLVDIFKEKECIEVRIRDFDIDYVLNEETQVNVMIEKTLEAIGKSAMNPSLGGIGLFKGKLVNLCGRLTQISMNSNGTSTEEDFEIIKFIEDNAPFTMLLRNPWIERDQARRKEEGNVLEQQRQELKEFITKRIM
jgi:hypothetical protein